MTHTTCTQSHNLAKNRRLLAQQPGQDTVDGQGVKLSRIIGAPPLELLDPFLLLDCFESDQAKDYIGGFPSHPHRGFETVTYLIHGRMRHKDNAGHEGVIEPGGVQWMTAGKGIVHSEMPEQQHGLLKGFQLWVNLPARLKMSPPSYQEFSPTQIPVESHENGAQVRVIAGCTAKGTQGPVSNSYTKPVYLDIHLPKNAHLHLPLAFDHTAVIYVIEGALAILAQDKLAQDELDQDKLDQDKQEQDDQLKQTDTKGSILGPRTLGILSKGDQVSVKSTAASSRFLLIAGQPLNEPVARGGPFVMNTQAQVLEAFDDYRHGRF